MKKSSVRVRFAPSPTGIMHLGNVRAALLNYLFAHHYNGTFVLRIEDTDTGRTVDPQAQGILAHLHWLGLTYDEGPVIGGPHAPYMQSERSTLYTQKLHELIQKKLAYPCFCTIEKLEKTRQRQIALKQPPRYDRTCLNLSEQDIEHNKAAGIPFIWRLRLDMHEHLSLTDLAKGTIRFDAKHFSDFPLTRQDQTATFIFANAVDDIDMKISHVIRGEDHLTNTVSQLALYHAFQAPVPLFWHLPIICNAQGKKLSKRDFGFSLQDLIDSGYLPQAIDNYLGVIGASFAQEIQTVAQLAQNYNFEKIPSTGQIRYDIEKLRWVNHQWIMRLSPDELIARCIPFLHQAFPQAANLPQATVHKLIGMIKNDMVTLQDCATLLAFYFTSPIINSAVLNALPHAAQARMIIQAELHTIDQSDIFVTSVKQAAAQQSIPVKDVFAFLRIALTGQAKGLGVTDIIELLGPDSKKRLEAAL